MITSIEDLIKKVQEFKTEKQAFQFFKSAKVSNDISNWFCKTFNSTGCFAPEHSFALFYSFCGRGYYCRAWENN